MKKALFLILLLCSGFFLLNEEKNPSVLYLTWLHDPATTMTLQWHSGKESSTLFYRKKGEENWLEAQGHSHRIEKGTLLWGELFVHTVELSSLQPDTVYAFRIGSESHQFRTLPKDGARPLHFVVGGDLYQSDIFRLKKMNAQVAKMDPDFVVLGGDIAYTRGHNAFLKGRYFEMKRWQTFLKEWKKQMVTTDGRLIPFLAVVGNHDVSSKQRPDRQETALFYELFALPDSQRAYRALDIGNTLSLFLLDTGHTSPIPGKQTDWLRQALQERQEVAHKIPIYHVNAYPSKSRFTQKNSSRVRENWSPLFEQFGVKVAFEHHEHTFKRTFPIKGEKIDPEGVVYLGDGGWGAERREPDPANKRWYLAKTASANFVYLVSLQGNAQVIQAIDSEGRVFDRVKPYTNP